MTSTPTGKSGRKQARKRLVKARQKRAARWNRAALVCSVLLAGGLATMVALTVTTDRDAVAWSSGATGLLAWTVTGLFVARERNASPGMTHLGWASLACLVVLGIALLTAQVLSWASEHEAARSTALPSTVPALLALALMLADGIGAKARDDATVTSMSSITNMHH